MKESETNVRLKLIGQFFKILHPFVLTKKFSERKALNNFVSTHINSKMTTILDVYAINHDELKKWLQSVGVELSSNPRLDYIHAIFKLRELGRLAKEDVPLTWNPEFQNMMLQRDNLAATIAELRSSVKFQLFNHLSKLVDIYTMFNDKHRASSFATAKEVVMQSIVDINSSSQFKTARGIGTSSLQEIDEYLTSGTSARLRELEGKYLEMKRVVDVLQDVHGIGPVKAVEFYREGVRTLGDLRKFPLTAAQQVGLQYHDDLKLRIPRDEMDLFVARMSQTFGAPNVSHPNGILWTVAGSYRRLEVNSGDVDVIIRVPEGVTAASAAVALGPLILATLASGPKKFMGVAKVAEHARRIDIRVFDEKVWPFALLYNTGSKACNVLMRIKAHEFGWELSEYGLSGCPEIIKTEEDVFRVLKLKFLKPEERTNHLVALETTS